MSLSVLPEIAPATPEDLSPSLTIESLGRVAVPSSPGESRPGPYKGFYFFRAFSSTERGFVEQHIDSIRGITDAVTEEELSVARKKVMARIREVTTGFVKGTPSPVDYHRTFGDEAHSRSGPELLASIARFATQHDQDIRRIYDALDDGTQ